MRNAPEDWAEYRDQLTELLAGLVEEACIQTPDDPTPGRVMFVGAGRCNDFDLRRITASSEHVILLDIDKEALKEAVSDLPEELRTKAEWRAASVTGINEDDLDCFCNDMLTFARSSGTELTLESFRRQLLTRLAGLEDKLVRKAEDLNGILREASADILVCCGVCSQLFSSLSLFIRSLLYSLSEILPDTDALEGEVNARIRTMDDLVIPVINRALCKAARKVIVFGNEYMPGRPVEGAKQCIEDVRMHLRPQEIHLMWNFNREGGITYDMLIQICRL